MSNTRYTALHTSPRAETLTLRALLDEVRAGRVRIPHFQRPLRWGAKDNVRLFDSLLRGYPIGSLLMWKRPAPAEHVKVGDAVLAAPARDDAWFVVDGQQRLTALAGAMLALAGQSEKYRIYLDVEKHHLHSGDDLPEGETTLIPLSTLVDAVAFRQWSRKVDVSDDALAGLDAFAKQLLEYRLPIYVVEAASDGEAMLRDIFARLNSTGARMAAHEVFLALKGGANAAEGELDFDRLGNTSEVAGFGALERSELLKIVLAASGLDPTRRPESLNEQDLTQLVAQEDAESALLAAITFLVQDAGIPHVRLLPYPVVLPILARFFHLFPNPDPANRRRLARWLWRGAVSGAHQRAEVSKMREAVRDLSPDAETPSVDRLLRHLPAAPFDGWDLRAFHARNARSRMEALALFHHQPLKLPLHLGGQPPAGPPAPVTLLSLVEGDRIATELLASPTWARLPDHGRALARTAANRVLLHDKHTGLATLVRKLDPNDHREILDSHLITAEAFAALTAGDDHAFLLLRAARVAEVTAAFLRERTGVGEPLLAPLASYFDASAEVGP